MHDDVKQHIEKALDEVRDIFMRAVSKIESLKVGEKVAGTALAEDIAASLTNENIAAAIAEGKLPVGTTIADEELVKSIKVSGPTIYPTLRYLYVNYPNTTLTRGAKGGITKLARPVASVDAAKFVKTIVELGTALLKKDKEEAAEVVVTTS